jgi:EAL domain-containing protein (putative c-di-GMP-specific phosphodiesterase class I)/GGDEF domain-containing protein
MPKIFQSRRINQTYWHCFLLISMTALLAKLVYLTGGTARAFPHLLYIPIFLGAYYFRLTGALMIAVLSGILVGPWMPASVATGEMQATFTWLWRMVMYVTLGSVNSILLLNVQRMRAAEIKSSYRDMFTGYPNQDRLAQDLKHLAQEGREFCLLGFRIKNIHEINRYTGYDIGIASIKEAASLLEEATGGTVYSLFLNDFVAVLKTGPEEAYAACMKYLERLKAPLLIDRYKLEIFVQSAIVHYPYDTKDPSQLIKVLCIALGQQSETRQGPVLFHAELERNDRDNYELMVALYNAISSNELFLVYQPKQDLRTGQMVGVEALTRWRHPTRGMIAPDIFIKLAEEIGLIHDITRWVVQTALKQNKLWQEQGMHVTIGINISYKDLSDKETLQFLKENLGGKKGEEARIEIELTERSLIDNAFEISAALDELKRSGVSIHLDDFGTGYNSLSNLVNLPIDCLKIDKMFMPGIGEHVSDAIIHALIRFCHKTQKRIIAEGVETKEQWEALKAMGVDYVQGYYYSKPLPPCDIKAFYDAQRLCIEKPEDELALV